MSDYAERIAAALSTMAPISLEEMSAVQLMNRIDTKFVTTQRQAAELFERAQALYFAQEINGDRLSPYRTTYFDTAEREQYLQHHNGHANRTKVRVRTYLSSGDLTFLEVKRKNNHGRTKKKRIPLDGSAAHEELSWQQTAHGVVSVAGVRTELSAAELVEQRTGLCLSDMRPVVENRFERATLVNKGKTERLTVDFGVRFRNPETGKVADVGDVVIIELKRDGNVFSPILPLLRALRIQPTGFSKCCIGMAMTNPDLKQNNFKQKIRLVGRLNRDENFRLRPYEDDTI